MNSDQVLQTKSFVVGTKQTVKALKAGTVKVLLLAEDADSVIKRKITEIAEANQVPVKKVYSMKELGKLCGIAVGAATVAITN
ncbi:ribosomal L7Ae/L30e/S12e/Gadd45 family protein [Bacillaceae bacterium Marseille-Q3522]|nr:ribosomal L7Ae/L30e/S12e/Gadd45 family protein [Bacillaceae bacterium Marseille-Q3522]